MSLTLCGLMTASMTTIGSGNGLLPDGSKPLPGPMLTSHKWNSLAFTWEQFNWGVSKILFCMMILKFTLKKKLLPYHSEVNELTIEAWSPKSQVLNYKHLVQQTINICASRKWWNNIYHTAQLIKGLGYPTSNTKNNLNQFHVVCIVMPKCNWGPYKRGS